MKTCVCCGRTFPDDVRFCPACGVDLDDPQESSAVQIEIDLEPEAWSPPREQTGFNEPVRTPVRQTMQTPVQPTLQIPVDPGLRKLYRSNQCFYACRCLVGAVVCLLGIVNRIGIPSLEHLPYLPGLLMEELRYGLETSDYFLAALAITAIVLAVLCFGRMVKPPEALLRDAKRSTYAYLRLFSFTDRCRIEFGGMLSPPLAKPIVLLIGFYSFLFMLFFPALYFTDAVSSSTAYVLAAAVSTYSALWLIRLFRVKSIYKKNMP